MQLRSYDQFEPSCTEPCKGVYSVDPESMPPPATGSQHCLAPRTPKTPFPSHPHSSSCSPLRENASPRARPPCSNHAPSQRARLPGRQELGPSGTSDTPCRGHRGSSVPASAAITTARSEHTPARLWGPSSSGFRGPGRRGKDEAWRNGAPCHRP
jgi:hypothetical protein